MAETKYAETKYAETTQCTKTQCVYCVEARQALKAEEAAARADGGEQGEDIAAGQGSLDDLTLERAELVVAKRGAEGVEKFFESRHGAGADIEGAAGEQPILKLSEKRPIVRDFQV